MKTYYIAPGALPNALGDLNEEEIFTRVDVCITDSLCYMAETNTTLLQEGGPLPGPETGLLSNTQK